MVILVDTREQRPLKFNHPYITDILKTKLDVGDYGCEFQDGFRPPIYFERKSKGDLYGTMGKGYPRFRKCLQRAIESKIRLFLIIEGTYSDILKGYKHSSLRGTTISRKLHTLMVKYDLFPIFCKDRKEMAQRIAETYAATGRWLSVKCDKNNGVPKTPFSSNAFVLINKGHEKVRMVSDERDHIRLKS